MSETVLKILLSELGLIRIICKQCGTVTETAVATLDRRQGKKRNDMRCPGCDAVLRLGGDADHRPPADGLDCLVDAWEKLAAIPNVEIQFVVKGGTDGLNCRPGS